MTEAAIQSPSTPPSEEPKLITFPAKPIPQDMKDVLTRAVWFEGIAVLLGSFRDEITASEAGLLRSHERHYKAFERLYEAFVFIKIHPDKSERNKLEKHIDKALKATGIETKKGTSLPHKLLKLTLGDDDKKRARISLYAQALTRAYLQGVKPGELASYLLSSGGWAGSKKGKDLAAELAAERDDSPADAEEETNDGDSKADAAFKLAAAEVRCFDKFDFPVEPEKLGWKDGDHHELVLLATYHPTTNRVRVHAVVANDGDTFNAVIRTHIKKKPAAFQNTSSAKPTEEDDEALKSASASEVAA